MGEDGTGPESRSVGSPLAEIWVMAGGITLTKDPCVPVQV